MTFSKSARETMLIKEHFLVKHGYEIKDVAKILGISKQTAYKYLNALIEKGVLIKDGKEYKSVNAEEKTKHVILAGLNESTVYDEWANEKIDAPKNVREICAYGFTEILNNAIEHSESEKATIFIKNDYSSISISIVDKGVGIFEKIKRERGLELLHHAIIELDKGKVTTDAEKHSGEGIFFTSKMFDIFSIMANGLVYRAKSKYNYQLLNEDKIFNNIRGTFVFMEICRASEMTSKEIFNQYTTDDFSFSKTVVPVIHLIDRKNEDTMSLISRSQARRLLAGFDKFKVVVLDFEGVELIGQGFADETFRVYPNANTGVKITYKNANKDVEFMIKHVINAT